MSKKKKTPNPILKEVRDVKYRQRVVADKKKQQKKNPPIEEL